jgi:hypothetical protein
MEAEYEGEYLTAWLEAELDPNDQRVARYLASLRQAIINPFVERLQTDFGRQTVALSGATDARVETMSWGWPRLKLGPPDDWDGVLNDFRKGAASEVVLEVELNGSSRLPPYIAVSLNFSSPRDALSLSSFRLWIEADLIRAGGMDHLQGVLTTEFGRAASGLAASYGHIMLDRALTPAHEIDTGRTEFDPLDVKTHVRGYQWGTYLSAGHISILGGLDRVRAEAPVHRVEVMPGRGGPIVFLQLTPSLDQVSDDDLRRLKQYLHPLLPDPPQEPEAYFGPPVRIVRLPDEVGMRRDDEADSPEISSDALAEFIHAVEPSFMAATRRSARVQKQLLSRLPKSTVPVEFTSNVEFDPLILRLRTTRSLRPAEVRRLEGTLSTSDDPSDELSHIELIHLGETRSLPDGHYELECFLDAAKAQQAHVDRLVAAVGRLRLPITRMIIGTPDEGSY